MSFNFLLYFVQYENGIFVKLTPQNSGVLITLLKASPFLNLHYPDFCIASLRAH